MAVIRLLVIFPLLATAINILPVPVLHWPQEINLSLASYYLLFHLISLPLVIFTKRIGSKRKKFGLAILLAAAISWHLKVMRPFYLPEKTPAVQGESATVSLLYANLFSNNRSLAEFNRMAQQLTPDIVALVEYTPRIKKELRLEAIYPHSVSIPRSGQFGLALYSKFPFTGEAETEIGPDLPPLISAEIEHPQGARFRVLVFHALPPVDDRRLYMRKVAVKRIAAKARYMEGNIILAGDFNATPFSALYGIFVRDSRFHDLFEGRGYRATWRAPGLPLLRFPIDHVLYRGNIAAVRGERMGDIGSDHLPLFGRFKIGLKDKGS